MKRIFSLICAVVIAVTMNIPNVIAYNDIENSDIIDTNGENDIFLMTETISGTCGKDLVWEFDESTGTLTISGTGNMYNYSNYGSKFSPWYNYRNNVTSVIVETGVTSIGSYVFWGCSSLGNVTIPKGVTSVGYSAFNGCSGLTDITIPESVTSIGGSAFSGCSSLTNITISEGVTSVGDSAFSRCSGLTSITLPNGLTSIGSSAFSGCSGLISITIPESVTSIGSSAFDECTALESVYITNISSYLNINYSDGYSSCPMYYANKLYINNQIVTSLIIPDDVVQIPVCAFSGCSGLTSITLPNSLTSIGSSAFSGCSGLTSITLPNSLTSIGSSAFSGCSGLIDITISDSVASIGNYVFYGCSGLTSITLPNSLTSIGSSAFNGCSSLTNITIPEGITSVGDSAFSRCSGLTSITLPNSLTSIGSSAFYDCSKLTSITLPNSLMSIGDYAFYGCSSLTNITIPEGITSVGDRTFSGCSELTSITLPNSLTSIGSSAFYDCSKLTSITLPNSLMSIGDYVFNGCSSLTNITIPEGITSVGDRTFSGCSELTSITLPNSLTSIGSSAFNGCSGLTSITIPESVTSIESYAFSGCSSLTNITISEGVTSVGDRTFSGCSELTSITLPNSLMSIGNYAFNGCSRLTSITIPKGVTSIGDSVFYNCKNLKQIRGLKGSVAETVSKKYGIKFIPFPQINFNSNGGNDITAIIQEEGSNVSPPNPPIKVGYTFKGWYADEELTQEYEFATMPEGDITLYAKWEVNQYTITFKTNGGDDILPITQDYGSVIQEPTPIKVGYTFKGWYEDEELTEKYEFTTMPNEAITLYAKWEINQYKITFHSNGGEEIQPTIQDYGTKIVEPTPIREESVFKGWYTDEELTQKYEFTTMPAGNITLYAKWEVNQYTISFETNGGDNVLPITQDYGSVIQEPTTSRLGYVFKGWYTDKELMQKYEFTTMPAGNITLYAKWEVNQYTISFETNGGDNVLPITQDYGSVIQEPTTSRLGYAFKGWYTDEELTQKYEFTTMPAGNMTLYAKWEANQYTISFETNGGDNVLPITQDCGSVVQEPISNKLGYVFAGWYTDEELMQKYEFKTMPAENITLYAKWEINQYTINFESNGGSKVEAITQDYGSDVQGPNSLFKTGHTFVGWYSDESLTEKYEFTTMPAENITLYAKWEINQYTISFESNGGGTVDAITQDYGTIVIEPTPTREEAVFKGWYTDKELMQKYEFATMPAENITLYAKWKINRYTITFETNGGSQISPITQDFNTEVIEPQSKKSGCIFVGWYTDEELTQKYEITTMPAQNITLYAKWKPGGQFTDTLSWYFDEETDTIYILGEGEIPDYNQYRSSNNTPPWDILGDEAKNIVFGKGITKIGAYNIWTDTMTSIKNVTIPDSVKKIDIRNNFTYSELIMPTSWFCFICSYGSYADKFADTYWNVSCLYIDNDGKVYPAIPSSVADKPSGEYYHVFESADEYEKLNSYTEGADIYYTIDGSDPYTNGKFYTEPFKFKPMTIKTVTKLEGYKDCISEYTFYEATAPKNLTIPSTTSTTMTFKFDMPNGVEDIDVYYIMNVSDDGSEVEDADATTLSDAWTEVEDDNKTYDDEGNVKITGLTPDTEYQFKISCLYNGGGSLDSETFRNRTGINISSECNILETKAPFMAQIDEANRIITSARYANKYDSLPVQITVSEGATWKLYTDKELKNIATDNVLPLTKEGGNNYGYILVTAEDGLNTKTYQLVVYRQSKSSPPTFSIKPGAVHAGTSVSITARGETIKYTTDSSSPGELDGYVYTEPIIINEETIIKAVAKESDKDEYSDEVTVKYVIGDPSENSSIMASYTEDVVSVTLSESVTEGVIIVAIYSDDGKLIDIKSENVGFERMQTFNFFENADYAKVFWWDSIDSMVPKIEPVIKNHIK